MLSGWVFILLSPGNNASK